jgi:ribosomal protein L11 methyltransferase
MSQIKYSFIASGPMARQAYAMLEAAFEDDACPLGVAEVDEAADLHEVSLYADSDDTDTTEGRMHALLDGLSARPPYSARSCPRSTGSHTRLRG